MDKIKTDNNSISRHRPYEYLSFIFNVEKYEETKRMIELNNRENK